MKRINLFLVFLLMFLMTNISLLNADIRGPYFVTDVSHATVSEGFGFIAVPLDAGLNTQYVRIQTLDGTGAEYTIRSNSPNAMTFAYYLTLGRYRIIEAPTDCRVMMNGTQVKLGDIIEVGLSSYIGFYRFL